MTNVRPGVWNDTMDWNKQQDPENRDMFPNDLLGEFVNRLRRIWRWHVWNRLIVLVQVCAFDRHRPQVQEKSVKERFFLIWQYWNHILYRPTIICQTPAPCEIQSMFVTLGLLAAANCAGCLTGHCSSLDTCWDLRSMKSVLWIWGEKWRTTNHRKPIVASGLCTEELKTTTPTLLASLRSRSWRPACI
jgi:hypothetical protein